MHYISTRGGDIRFSSALAIRQGIAPDGGLLVPESFPSLTLEEITAMADMNYIDRAVRILSLYLTDYSPAELREFTELAYDEAKFGPDPAPLVQLNKYNDREYILELWHGPTAAFKDMALQLLPHLMTAALRKTGEPNKVCILTATSGDTGKAALEGFRDVPGTSVIVFYPSKGVSDAQRLQMVTQEGDNLQVIAVEGNFDDAQTGVKRIFADDALRIQLQQQGIFLSSANSINWGRLVPQIVYYFSAYADLIKREKSSPVRRSTLSCQPAISAISWLPSTPAAWACRSTNCSVPPIATGYCPISSGTAAIGAGGSSSGLFRPPWTFLFPATSNVCCLNCVTAIAARSMNG